MPHLARCVSDTTAENLNGMGGLIMWEAKGISEVNLVSCGMPSIVFKSVNLDSQKLIHISYT